LESAISRQWYQLYENNPKIQAFAVAKGAEIVWQTENWNLLDDIKELVAAPKDASGKVSAFGVKYKRVASTQDTYIGSAAGDKGYLLIARINENGWAIAWAESTSVPELALIDLIKTAVHLNGDVR
jgi:hypothetical protein